MSRSGRSPDSSPSRVAETAFVGEGFVVATLLGLASSEASTLHERLRQGLPYGSLEGLRSVLGVPLTEFGDLVGIPYRTLVRRRKEKRLRPDESDRLVRLARLVAMAGELFGGDLEAASAWLAEPQDRLGGRVPLEYATTEAGAREVERTIGRIAYGIPL